MEIRRRKYWHEWDLTLTVEEGEHLREEYAALIKALGQRASFAKEYPTLSGVVRTLLETADDHSAEVAAAFDRYVEASRKLDIATAFDEADKTWDGLT